MNSHDWNQGGSEIKLQISRRETPTLPTERRAQIEQSYFRFLPFAPAEIVCLALAEILAEKIRACYQRNKARDIYDLGTFATRPLDQARIRRLVVLKLWQARDTFDPARLIQKFEDGRDFDWDDLRQPLNRAVNIDRERITGDCVRGFGFLANLTDDERTLARDHGSALHANYWHALWIYFMAPSMGMLAAGEVFLRVRRGAAPYCAKLHHANNKRCIFHHAQHEV